MTTAHHVAQHLANRGRNGDSMLMHVSPEELHGLQALAVHKGTSLTINPETGLPEAFSLKSLLPALAGFALGPAGFGLMSTLGAAATVGGITALTSHDLGKGLMAGLGAYGGSSLGEGFMGMGGAGAGLSGLGGVEPSVAGGATAAQQAAMTSAAAPTGFGATQAGLQTAFNDPSKIMPAFGGGEKLLKTAAMAAAPVLADQMVPTTTKMPNMADYNPGYIRTYHRDPVTGVLTANTPVKASEWGTRDINSNTPFAAGGLTAFAEGGKADDTVPLTLERNTPPAANTMTGESLAAYNFLMGKGDYPGRTDVTSKIKPTTPIIDPNTGPPKGNGGDGTIIGGGGGGGGGNGTIIGGGNGTIIGGGNGTGTIVGGGLSTLTGGFGGTSGLKDSDADELATIGGNANSLSGSGLGGDHTGISAGSADELATIGGNANSLSGTGLGDTEGDINGLNNTVNWTNTNYGPNTSNGLNDLINGARGLYDSISNTYLGANDYAVNKAKDIGTTALGGIMALTGLGMGDRRAEGDLAPVETATRRPADEAAYEKMMENLAKPRSVDVNFGGTPKESDPLDALLELNNNYNNDQSNNYSTAPEIGDNLSSYDYGGYDYGGYDGGAGIGGGGNFPNMDLMAHGGIAGLPSDLGGYSDGGRLLRGPGDGVSDSIPATIGRHQPARLADGEFVVPARIVSELGNGSTEAGARALYKMMDRIQAARGRTIGKNKVAANSNAAKYLPA